MLITHSSTAKQEEKLKERGSCQTLNNIPLRSMLFNGGVPLLKDSQPYRSETMVNNASTGSRNSATPDLELFVFYHLTNRIRIMSKLKSNAHGKMTWHAAVRHIETVL